MSSILASGAMSDAANILEQQNRYINPVDFESQQRMAQFIAYLRTAKSEFDWDSVISNLSDSLSGTLGSIGSRLNILEGFQLQKEYTQYAGLFTGLSAERAISVTPINSSILGNLESIAFIPGIAFTASATDYYSIAFKHYRAGSMVEVLATLLTDNGLTKYVPADVSPIAHTEIFNETSIITITITAGLGVPLSSLGNCLIRFGWTRTFTE